MSATTQRNYTHNGNGVRAMRRDLNQPQHAALLSRMPPQDIPLEEAVLGAMMLDRNALTNAGPLFKPEIFYLDIHQKIAKAILSLFGASKPIDLLTMTDELKRSGELESIGGGYYLVELTNKVASAANIEYHTRIVYQEYIKRTVIENCSRAISSAYDNTSDPFDLIDELTKFCIESNSGLTTGQSISIGKAANNVLERVAAQMMKGEALGLSTGFYDLDRLSGGLFAGEFSIFAARPGMGKTQLTLQSAMNIARQGKHVHFVSLEMTPEQLATRVLSEISGVSQSKIRSATLTNDDLRRMQEAKEQIRSLPFNIASCRTSTELFAYASMNKARGELDLLLIDYLQLVSGDMNGRGLREQEIAVISRTCKRISTDFNIPVGALSQLSRAVETRPGAGRPQLSDLRESGSLEQDADNVYFIWRPEVYGVDEIETPEHGVMSAKDISIIIGAKMRSNSLFEFPMKFQHGVFSDYESNGHQRGIVVNGQNFTSLSDDIPSSNGAGASIEDIMRNQRGNDEDIPF